MNDETLLRKGRIFRSDFTKFRQSIMRYNYTYQRIFYRNEDLNLVRKDFYNISLFFSGEKNELRESLLFYFITITGYDEQSRLPAILLLRYQLFNSVEFKKKKRKNNRLSTFKSTNKSEIKPVHLVDRRIIKSRSTGIVQLSNLGRDRRPCL